MCSLLWFFLVQRGYGIRYDTSNTYATLGYCPTRYPPRPSVPAGIVGPRYVRCERDSGPGCPGVVQTLTGTKFIKCKAIQDVKNVQLEWRLYSPRRSLTELGLSLNHTWTWTTAVSSLYRFQMAAVFITSLSQSPVICICQWLDMSFLRWNQNLLSLNSYEVVRWQHKERA